MAGGVRPPGQVVRRDTDQLAAAWESEPTCLRRWELEMEMFRQNFWATPFRSQIMSWVQRSKEEGLGRF